MTQRIRSWILSIDNKNENYYLLLTWLQQHPSLINYLPVYRWVRHGSHRETVMKTGILRWGHKAYIYEDIGSKGSVTECLAKSIQAKSFGVQDRGIS